MKFSTKNFFSKCDQIRRKLRIWSHLPKEILTGKLHFLCSVYYCYIMSLLGDSYKQFRKGSEIGSNY